MFERRTGDDDGVDVGRRKHLLEILVDLWTLCPDLRSRLLNAVVEEIAQGGDTGAGIGVHDGCVVGSAIAGPDQPDADLGIGLRPANGLRRDNGKRCGGADEIPARKWRVLHDW